MEDNPSEPEPVGGEYAVSQIWNRTGGQKGEVTTYTYDHLGRPLEAVTEGYSDNDVVEYVMTESHTYGDGIIFKEVDHILRYVYKLDDSGRVVECTVYPVHAEPYILNTITYDENGLMATCFEEGALMKLHWENGDLMGWDEFAEDGSIVGKATIEYNDIESEHCLAHPLFTSWNDMLYARGFYGKVSRHLPIYYKRENFSADGTLSFYIERTYTYELTGGRVSSYTDQGETTGMLYGMPYTATSTKTYHISWTRL